MIARLLSMLAGIVAICLVLAMRGIPVFVFLKGAVLLAVLLIGITLIAVAVKSD